MSSTKPIPGQIVHVHKTLYEIGFSVGNDGNTSYRKDAKSMWITPAGLDKAKLLPIQISLVKISDASLIKGKHRPSTEWQLHSEIYKLNPTIQCIVHSHPPYSIACSLAGISFEEWILPELTIALGPIPTLSYTCPGTLKIAKQAAEAIRDRKALVLQRHGVVTVGDTLAEALTRMEWVEHAAKILLLASSAGKLTPLTFAEKTELKTQIQNLYEKV